MHRATTCPISGENTCVPTPATPDDLFNLLKSLNIAFAQFSHPALFTVAEGVEIEKNIPGTHCRNLFLKDKKGRMFLVVAANETAIDLKKLGTVLGASGRLSFGSPERLMTYLGITPGSVCPFTIMNDHQNLVTLVLDAHMMRADIVNYHPLVNTMTVSLSPSDLLRFAAHYAHTPVMFDPHSVRPDAS